MLNLNQKTTIKNHTFLHGLKIIVIMVLISLMPSSWLGVLGVVAIAAIYIFVSVKLQDYTFKKVDEESNESSNTQGRS